MKLTIIRLQQLSAQDRADLKKIWPRADIDSLEQQLNAHQQLYAARFNDRLLAAVRVTIDKHRGQLSQLEVREVTRRRGVGRYLLEETQAQNPQIGCWSVASDGSMEPEIIAAFLQSAGFIDGEDGWTKALAAVGYPAQN